MTTMYLPALLSLRDVLGYLDAELHDYGVQYDVILTELLKEMLANSVSNFGINGNGPLGSLKCQLPENSGLDDATALGILHRAHLLLVDVVADIVPQDQVQHTFPYYYPNGDSFILYIPTQPGTVSEAIRKKLVPASSIHYLHQ